MAQSIPPGDLGTCPNKKFIFNGSFDYKHIYHLKVMNFGSDRIGCAIKTTKPARLEIDPPHLVLDPEEDVLVAVLCDAFAFGDEDTSNDRIIIEWTKAPAGSNKQFRPEWLEGGGIVRRKILPIKYNV